MDQADNSGCCGYSNCSSSVRSTSCSDNIITASHSSSCRSSHNKEDSVVGAAVQRETDQNTRCLVVVRTKSDNDDDVDDVAGPSQHPPIKQEEDEEECLVLQDLLESSITRSHCSCTQPTRRTTRASCHNATTTTNTCNNNYNNNHNFTFRLERRRGALASKDYSSTANCNITNNYPSTNVIAATAAAPPTKSIGSGRSVDEERILLFRSDRPGAIGKIVFSVMMIPMPITRTRLSHDDNNCNNIHHVQQYKAKIHVLEVKQVYRGQCDFGGFLFCQALSAIRQRLLVDVDAAAVTNINNICRNDNDCDTQTASDIDSSAALPPNNMEHEQQQSPSKSTSSLLSSSSSFSCCCDLEVEEDCSRHNRLVRFYEQLGCYPRKKSQQTKNNNNNNKVTYLYHNNGESYRKIPMQIHIAVKRRRRQQQQHHHNKNKNNNSECCNSKQSHKVKTPNTLRSSTMLMNQNFAFLPVRFCMCSTRQDRGRVRDSNEAEDDVVVVVVELPVGTHRMNQRTNIDRRQRRIQWLISDNNNNNGKNGYLQIRTTEGHVLVANPNGSCTAVVDDVFDSDDDDDDDELETATNDDDDDDWTCFQLRRASSAFCQGKNTTCSSSDCDNKNHGLSIEEENNEERWKGLWTLVSVHGSFLTLTCDKRTKRFCCVNHVAFWKIIHGGDHNNNMLCMAAINDDDNVNIQLYIKNMLNKQTVQYVQGMRTRYLLGGVNQKPLVLMTLWDALTLVQRLPGLPFHVGSSGPSLRTICFSFAERARKEGHPDWVQLVALIHKLGSVVKLLNTTTAPITMDDDFDWTISPHSRIVGCHLPDNSMFSFHSQMVDIGNGDNEIKLKSLIGMYDLHCGLGNVMLAWTGQEYLYHMLLHNSVAMPAEGYAVLRLGPLLDWHSKGLYRELCNEDDLEMLPFVKDFYDLMERTQKECATAAEMTDACCEELWASHYSQIVSKYMADGALMW